MTSTSLETAAESKQPLALSWVNVVFFGAFHALALLAPWFFSWSALGTAIFLHWLFGSIGICLGYHRLLTHRSFQVPKWLERTITLIGALALQGGPTFWVAGHRMHHLYTEDNEKDPYSAQKGFWWSHMMWLFYPQARFFDRESYRQFAPDIDKDPFYRFLDRYFLLLQVPVGVTLYLLGGWSFVIYGVFLRAVLLWHSTWLINSASHMSGYRTFEPEDNSRNLWWAAILTYGEGWHNNHHAYPNVAKAGLKWWEIDMTWWSIAVLKRLGLAKRVVMPQQTN
ncbi:fatty acid desaturase [Phormidium sp. FACHB-592]|uniref:Fatty acid desaturase n=1 Tax=Stenomitos frigidus AS-A4 TaxID=2933935 RepID=A0ABV0KCU0_9CYAN|nr:MULTISPECIES: fatty acid desaturase [Cyanophyceae]MBD2038138.1 fatty acid desaturase [Leptolyngbya sp. FACHB-321]MBD2077660.1 fatty acid desaturase [Phormidium sp. FACHB-592]